MRRGRSPKGRYLKGDHLLRTAALMATLVLLGTMAAFSQFDVTPSQVDMTPAEKNLLQFFFSESFTPENRIELTPRIDAVRLGRTIEHPDDNCQ